MTEIKYILGNKIELDPRPSNIYRLSVKCMHGDADHYTTHNRDFHADEEGQKKLETALAGFIAFCRLDWNTACDWEPRKDESLTAEQKESYENIVSYDIITCDDRLASPDHIKVTYFSSDGDEYEVTLNINGKDFTELTRCCLECTDHKWKDNGFVGPYWSYICENCGKEDLRR
jgi:hypothetical protein